MPSRTAARIAIQHLRREAIDELEAAARESWKHQAVPTQKAYLDKVNRLDRAEELIERTEFPDPDWPSDDHVKLAEKYDQMAAGMCDVLCAGYIPSEGQLDAWQVRINDLDRERGSRQYDGRTGEEIL